MMIDSYKVFLSSSNTIMGCPAINVNIEDIEFLRSLRFCWQRIAQILGISRSTLYRRLNEEGLSRSLSFSVISDADLDKLVTDIKDLHPNDGERLLMGHLVSRNVFVPRARLQGAIHRVDPINTALRRSVTIRRRRYVCAGPNAVWHIDGNHKLIKWRFVIHGAIDGFSRTVAYLHCSDNNQAVTVLNLFTIATQLYGLPCKVRSDLGGENIEVWRYMIENHASESAVITGSSTHNERIERLWRDVYRSVGVLFANTFYQLEDEGKLNCLNEIDLYCLHFIFKPRINSTLRSFIECWNNHSISTEKNYTPNQLFVQGMIEANNCLETQNMPQFASNYQQTLLPRDHVQIPRGAFSLACHSQSKCQE
jgi:AraC-like DNA-binding protein